MSVSEYVHSLRRPSPLVLSGASEWAVAVTSMAAVLFPVTALCLPKWIYDKHSRNCWCDIIGPPLPLVFWVTGGLSATVVEAPAVAIGCAGLFLSATAFFLSAYKYYPHTFSCMWGSIRTLSPVVFTRGLGLTTIAVPAVGGFSPPAIVCSFHPYW